MIQKQKDLFGKMMEDYSHLLAIYLSRYIAKTKNQKGTKQMLKPILLLSILVSFLFANTPLFNQTDALNHTATYTYSSQRSP